MGPKKPPKKQKQKRVVFFSSSTHHQPLLTFPFENWGKLITKNHLTSCCSTQKGFFFRGEGRLFKTEEIPNKLREKKNKRKKTKPRVN
jgi:hypothetical protein